MENRIDRKDDESLYQPKIYSERIRALYQIKQTTGKPMTVLLDQANRIFLVQDRHVKLVHVGSYRVYFIWVA
jgi:hypothetical protein